MHAFIRHSIKTYSQIRCCVRRSRYNDQDNLVSTREAHRRHGQIDGPIAMQWGKFCSGGHSGYVSSPQHRTYPLVYAPWDMGKQRRILGSSFVQRKQALKSKF